MSENEVTVGPETQPARSNSPKKKPAPRKGKCPLEFVYHPSHDGTDENLLILLHGLGEFGTKSSYLQGCLMTVFQCPTVF